MNNTQEQPMSLTNTSKLFDTHVYSTLKSSLTHS